MKSVNETVLTAKDFDTEYPGVYLGNKVEGLYSHMSMALRAAHFLGASSSQLEGYQTFWSKILVPVKDEDSKLTLDITRENYSTFLGEAGNARFPIAQFFRSDIKQFGLGETVKFFTPILMSGCGASLVHPIIRLQFAVEADDVEEAAMALADWTRLHLPLLPLGKDEDLTDAKKMRDLIIEWYSNEDVVKARGLYKNHFIGADKMQWIASQAVDTFGEYVWPAVSMKDLAELTLHAYNSTHDFIMLHALDAVYAYRIISAGLSAEQDRECRRYLFQAVVMCSMVADECAFDNVSKPTNMMTWAQVHAELSKKGRPLAEVYDDHDLKLAYVCEKNAAFWGNERYLWAAIWLVQYKMK